MRQTENLITVLTEDHYEIRQLFTDFEHLSNGETLRLRLAEQLILEMVRHLIVEECYLYPLIVDRLPDGAAQAEAALAEHRRIEQELQRLDRDLPEEEVSRRLCGMLPDVRNHTLEEEEKLFPQVARVVSEEELVELGRLATESKAKSPSRLSAQDRPPLQTLLASGAGLIERLRLYLCGEDAPYYRTR